MKKLRLITALLLLPLLLGGCGSSTRSPLESASPAPLPGATFIAGEDTSGLFPFYFIDEQNMLCRAQDDADAPVILDLDKQVRYVVDGNVYAYIKYYKAQDLLLFATDIQKDGENITCTLNQYAKGKLSVIDTRVLLYSIDAGEQPQLLYISMDAAGKRYLYVYGDGVRTFYAEDVLEAYFTSSDGDVVLLSSTDPQPDGQGGLLYPVYGIWGNNAPLIMGYANTIARVDKDSGRICLLQNRRTVSLLNDRIKVADVQIFSIQGSIRLDVENVLEDWLLADGVQAPIHYLLAYVPGRQNRLCELYRVDEDTPELLTDNVMEGRFLSTDHTVFGYEVYPGSGIGDSVIELLHADGRRSVLPSTITSRITNFSYDSLNNLVYFKQIEDGLCSLYAFRFGGEIYTLKVQDNISEFYPQQQGAIYTVKNTSDKFYSIYYDVNSSAEILVTNALLLSEAPAPFVLSPDNSRQLLYYSEDTTFVQGGINISRGGHTSNTGICLWNVLPEGGLLYSENMQVLAAVCREADGGAGLFVSYANGSVADTGHSASLLVPDVLILR